MTTSFLERIAGLPPKRLALLAAELKARLDQAESRRPDPIAVIGLGCRLPGGVDGPEAFWRLLAGGEDAIGPVPPSRWNIDEYMSPDPDAPGKMYANAGGFVDGADLFDPRFFGISPREAESMDPQQRLLLEVTWEALENAGLAPDRLAGSDTGVFVGIGNDDYTQMILRAGDPEKLDVYTSTGAAFSVAAGRIAYALGLRGPAMAVDTACSSSLLAVHLASQSLRAGECRVAVAGGVHLILRPELSICLSRSKALSPTGRCRTFDAAADGYVRAEGCGMVVLKRLRDAVADRDTILAVIRASGVNHDGRKSGLTVPNGLAQEALIRKVLAEAGAQPSDVGYVEAHGTGTPLGDPIEVEAIDQALGEGRPGDRPLWIGSVKTNVGHLETAAGVTGLLKLILSLSRGVIPPHLHFRSPSPHIPWSRARVRVPVEQVPWPAGPRPRLGAVSSFGMSGTNVHVLVEEAPAPAGPPPGPARPHHLLALSARSEAALARLCERFAAHLERAPDAALGDICFTAATGRARFPHRCAVVGASRDDLRAALAAAKDAPHPAADRRPRVAFVFTGQGPLPAGTGRELDETQIVFKEAVDRCAEALAPYLDRPLRDILFPADGAAPLPGDAAHASAARFAIAMALAALWRSWGVEPDAARGEGVGEIAASVTAGALSLGDAASRVASRAPLAPRAEPPPGASLAAEGCDVVIEIGPPAAPHPPAGGAGQDGAAGTSRSSVSGGGSSGGGAVRLPSLREGQHGLRTMLEGLAVLYERGADVDLGAIDRGGNRRRVALPTYPFQRSRFWVDPPAGPAPARAQAATRGETAPETAPLGRRLALPLCSETVFEAVLSTARLPFLDDHRIYGQVVVPGAFYVSMLATAAGSLRPGPCVLEDTLFPRALVLPEGEARTAQLVLAPDGDARAGFQVATLSTDGRGEPTVHAAGRVSYGRTDLRPGALSAAALAAIEARCPTVRPAEELFYAVARPAGLELGPGFRWLGEVRRRDGEALCDMRAPEGAPVIEGCPALPGLVDSSFQLLAATLPSAGRHFEVQVPLGFEKLIVYSNASGPLRCHAVLTSDAAAETRIGDVTLYDASGAAVIEVKGLRFRRGAERALTGDARDRVAGCLHEVVWRPAPRGPSTARPGGGTWLLLGAADTASELARGLEARGHASVVAVLGRPGAGADTGMLGRPGAGADTGVLGRRGAAAGTGTLAVDPTRPEDFARLLEEAFPPGGAPCAGVVVLATDDDAPAEDLAARASRVAGGALFAAQALLRRSWPRAPRLTLVTRGAQPAGCEVSAVPWGAMLWGLGRVLAREHPEVWGGLVDLGPSAPAEELRALAAELVEPDGEEAVALRGAARYAPRLGRLARPGGDVHSAFPMVRPEGAYLVTGGLGGLGLAVAAHLAARGASTLILAGRRAPEGEALSAVRRLEESGTRVTVVLADVAHPDGAARLRSAVAAAGAPLRGVVHAAGVLADGAIVQLGAERLARALAPKVEGTLRLAEAVRGQPLDFFVMFSSMTSLLGAPGQGGYAAANAFMDAFAHSLRSSGVPATSVQWGPWGESGMAARSGEAVRASWREQGIRIMDTREGLAALDRLLSARVPEAGVLDVAWSTFCGRWPPGGAPSLLRELDGRARPAAASVHKPNSETDLARRIAEAPAHERRALLGEHVREQIARVLRIDPAEAWNPRHPLFEMGLDSLMAVELRDRLQASLGRPLPATLVFDHPSTEALTRYLCDEVLRTDGDPSAAAPRAPAALAPDSRAPAVPVPAPDPRAPAREAPRPAARPEDLRELPAEQMEALLRSKLDRLARRTK